MSHPGLISILEQLYSQADESELTWLEAFRAPRPCLTCAGTRLRREALAVLLCGQSIADICNLSIDLALDWFEGLKLPEDQIPIAQPILAEMLHRLRFLVRVGVGYLTLARSADSLSGGELQRVRLATCIGNGLAGVCYILDEPSIGLHQRDNDRLIESLKDLQRLGNTVIVVEHDEAMMRAADLLIDMGPGAGTQGGQVVASGSPAEVAQHPTSLTAAYLRGERQVPPDRARRSPRKSKQIRLSGASLHNLKHVNLEVPLGLLVGITGVSGSGKSSLISRTLVPATLRELGQSTTARPGAVCSIERRKEVDKLIELSRLPSAAHRGARRNLLWCLRSDSRCLGGHPRGEESRFFRQPFQL